MIPVVGKRFFAVTIVQKCINYHIVTLRFSSSSIATPPFIPGLRAIHIGFSRRNFSKKRLEGLV